MIPRSLLPNLNSLRVFEAAGRHLSFKAAANELHVTPSAISQQIKSLEAELGVPLFKRHNRALELTGKGRQYWQQVSASLRTLQQHTAKLVHSQAKELKVSLLPPLANSVVLPNLSRFHQQHSSINLRLDSSQKLREVMQGEVDVAIRFGHSQQEQGCCEILSEVMIQLVCPPGFSERYDLRAHPENLGQVPWIHMSQNPESWQHWLEASGLDIALQGKQYVLDNYPSAIQAAESLGAMLAILPLENERIRKGQLETPFPAIGPIDKQIYALYQSNSPKLDSIQAFVSWLRSEIDALRIS